MNVGEVRVAAVPLDVRWRLCPTEPATHNAGLRPRLGRSPKLDFRRCRKGEALPHIGRHSRGAFVQSTALPHNGQHGRRAVSRPFRTFDDRSRRLTLARVVCRDR